MQYTYTYNPLEPRNDRTYRKRCIDEMYEIQLAKKNVLDG